jgi:hypothetical protein
MDLDRVPLCRGSSVSLKQLWSDYSQYLYLPRLRDSKVMLDAVRQGVALLTWDPDTFAYASAVEEPSGRYTGLVAGEHAAAVLDATSVVVKADVAARQLAEERSAVASTFTPDPAVADTETGIRPDPGSDTSATRPGPAAKTRFYGRVSLEPVRMLRDLGEIADAIVTQLGRADAEVKITIEVEAIAENGFDDDVRRTVSENARTLKFETHEFED